MSTYSNPIPVGNGTVSTFFTSYPPVQGNIGTNPAGWTFRSGYVAPFRSFDQQLVNASWNLGPYCRKLDGTSGRIVLDQSTADIGFATQCWYDYPRTPLEPYEENSEWWAKCGKVRIQARDQMTSGNPWITVEVAISNYQSSSINLFEPPTYFGLFLTRIIKLIDHAIRGGNCGTNSKSGYPDSSTLNSKSPGILSDLGGLINGGLSALGNLLGSGGPLFNSMGNAYGSPSEGPAAPGGPLSDANRANTLGGWLGDHLTKFNNWVDDMNDYVLSLATETAQQREEHIKQVAGIFGAVPEAGNLFVNGWLIPNMNLIGTPNGPGSDANPYQWRPSNESQERYASYLSGDPTVNSHPFTNGVPTSTPTNPDTGQSDWGWFLTMLNRGNTAAPTVDTTTNEVVILENYGFNRGGSIAASTDTFLNSVDSTFGSDVGDSLGTLLDMSPGAPFFVATVLPIVVLEQIGRANKVAKGETVNPVTNLDGLVDTKFELRISAKNLKAGNPTLYNYLTTTGDANGNTITQVP